MNAKDREIAQLRDALGEAEKAREAWFDQAWTANEAFGAKASTEVRWLREAMKEHESLIRWLKEAREECDELAVGRNVAETRAEAAEQKLETLRSGLEAEVEYVERCRKESDRLRTEHPGFADLETGRVGAFDHVIGRLQALLDEGSS
jgi:chromosome segregation ATPase